MSTMLASCNNPSELIKHLLLDTMRINIVVLWKARSSGFFVAAGEDPSVVETATQIEAARRVETPDNTHDLYTRTGVRSA
jgi:hypothetical protein